MNHDCFRFLINVDQCLNMSNFDIFFYKLESQHKLHKNQVQMFGESDGTSLRHAVMDIRMYLNKYPYHVDDYQIIVAMRSEFKKQKTAWQETLLYRLLQLNYELQQANIYVTSQEKAGRAINLVMLYNANFNAELPELDFYMAGPRVSEDCALMFRELGLDWDGFADPGTLDRALTEYERRPDRDTATVWMLREFQERFRKSLDSEKRTGLTGEAYDGRIAGRLLPYLKELLANYQVFETLVNRNNEREKLLSLLQLVEFINRSTEMPVGTGPGTIVSLASRCRQNWEAVIHDEQLEKKYGDMLFRYRRRLNDAARELSGTGTPAPGTKSSIPQKKIPEDTEIHADNGKFSEDSKAEREKLLSSRMQRFVKSGVIGRGSFDLWEQTYQDLKESLDRMEQELKEYAGTLSRQYSAILDTRKRETRAWETGSYALGPDIENDVARADYEKEEFLKKLTSPRMSPTLTFQDQLNMENALEKCNLNIRFNIQCVRSVTLINFLALFLLVFSLFFGHYVLLQPYVFLSGSLLGETVLCLLAVAVFLLTAYQAPRVFFRGRIKKNVQELQEYMKKYISGYYDKAACFCTYINLLNQLDYIIRYSKLLERVMHEAGRQKQCRMWHKVHVERHLTKLQFFRGLIDLSDGGDHGENELHKQAALFQDKMEDVMDCPVYWPQG